MGSLVFPSTSLGPLHHPCRLIPAGPFDYLAAKEFVRPSFRNLRGMSFTVVLVIALMLLLNGVFAAYELALASVRTDRLRLLAEQKRRGAGVSLRMKGRMEASLAAVQLGITLVGAIAAALGGASAEESLAPYFERVLSTVGLHNCRRRADSQSLCFEERGARLLDFEPDNVGLFRRIFPRGLAI